MAGIDIISRLLLIENIFCVYRNYYFLNRMLKYLAVAWAGMDAAISVIAFCFSFFILISNTITMNSFFMAAFGILTNFNAVLVITLGFNNSSSFKDFYAHLEGVYNEFKDEKTFQKNLNKPKILCCILTMMFILNYTTMVTIFVWEYVSDRIAQNRAAPLQDRWFAFGVLLLMSSEYRYFVEFLSQILLTSIVCECLKFLKLQINKLAETGHPAYVENFSGIRIQQNKNNLSKWVATVRHLSECGTQLGKCFGIQAVFSLFTVIVYFVLQFYHGITSLTENKVQQAGAKNPIFLLTNYSMVITAMLYTGQTARREADGVTRALARLYNTLVTIPGEDVMELRKSVKNLHRQLVVKPIRIELLSSVSVHMPLLPNILAAIITYTVILLQFNHVV